MPRPKKDNAAEPKKRSRTGCWPCKARKVKCGEEKPHCQNCVKQSEACDYSIRLNWGGRTSNKHEDSFFVRTSSDSTAEHTPISQTRALLTANIPLSFLPDGPSTTPRPTHSHSHSHSRSSTSVIDPQLSALDSTQHHQSGSDLGWQDDMPSTTELPPRPTPSLSDVGHMSSSFQLPPLARYSSYGETGQSTSDTLDGMGGQVQPRLYPFPDFSPRPSTALPDFRWSSQHNPAKRTKLSSSQGFTLPRPEFIKPALPDAGSNHFSLHEHNSPGSTMFTPYTINSVVDTPLTPGSSIASDEVSSRVPPSQHRSSGVQESPDLRRLSVHSLLSGPPGDDTTDRPRDYPRPAADGGTVYGYDYGVPDLDLPRNNDMNAITPQSPAASRSAGSSASSPSETRLVQKTNWERTEYYAQPVPINIPSTLEPLPRHLAESPMNLLYFHHFLNHTARVLIPVDCPNNQLRHILPQMAVRDANLLNLLLAYSASHRAKLLNHPEPSNRIALWVRDVFPSLRHALSSGESASDETLATAIMLSSLEIITPNTFEVPVTWQNHLQIARQMINARGGLKALSHSKDKNLRFLCEWFAYLDVLGSLSGSRIDQPVMVDYWAFDAEEIEEGDYELDCFSGFTTRCGKLLARVAKLGQACDAEHIDAAGNVRPGWQPSPAIRELADKLHVALEKSRRHPHHGCVHIAEDSAEQKPTRETEEIAATNEAFHWAGLIHLKRRVLAVQPHDPENQACISQVIAALKKVRPGSSAESCLLFPMFIAGCDAVGQEQRDAVMERLNDGEGWGMAHVLKARNLMQNVWDTGKPWESLVAGEFFG